MFDCIQLLTDMIASNGYDVQVRQSSAGVVVDILHEPTQREAVYAYNRMSREEVCRSMAMQYCTHEQLNELAQRGANWIEAGRQTSPS